MRMELTNHSISGHSDLIISGVRNRSTGFDNTTHRRLEIQAKNMKRTQGMRVKAYMAMHKFLRIQMLQSKYPNIKKETTSVRIALTGAADHPNLREISRVLRFIGLQSALRELEDRLADEKTSIYIETMGCMTEINPVGSRSDPLVGKTVPNFGDREGGRSRGRK